MPTMEQRSHRVERWVRDSEPNQMYRLLSVETAPPSYNSNENRIIHIETKMIKFESELMSIKQTQAVHRQTIGPYASTRT